MRVLGLCFGFALLVSVGTGIATQGAPTDARRSEAAAVADVSIKQRGGGPLAPESRVATAAVPLAGTMTIAPAPVIDAGDEMFIGTGDFSNGFWARP
jgi:hypothetical protein